MIGDLRRGADALEQGKRDGLSVSFPGDGQSDGFWNKTISTASVPRVGV